MGFVNRVAFGMCAAVPTFALSSSLRTLGYISEKCKMRDVFYKFVLDRFTKLKSPEIASRALSAICPYSTMANAINTSEMHSAHVAKALALSVLTSSYLLEDFIYRGVVQELLLRKLPIAIMKEIKPGSEAVVDCKTAKIIRVIFSSAICINIGRRVMQPAFKLALQSSSCEMTQQVGFIIDTVVSSILKETYPGLVGSMTQHLTYAVLSMPRVLFDC